MLIASRRDALAVARKFKHRILVNAEPQIHLTKRQIRAGSAFSDS